MARTKGSANFAGSLEVLAGAPLDARLVVNAKTDLTAATSYPYKYIGMIVSVRQEQRAYMLVDNDTTDIDNWKVVGGDSLDVVVYRPAGSILFADRPATLTSTLVGNVYYIKDNFTTTADFVEGAGHNYSAGTSIYVIDMGTQTTPDIKWDVLSASVDFSKYQEKFQYGTLPTPVVDIVDCIYQYVGATNAYYTNGYFYKCIENPSSPGNYIYVNVDVQEITGVAKQVTTMPAVTALDAGKVVQYIGGSTADYTSGFFYECIEDTTNPGTYIWAQKNVQPDSDTIIQVKTMPAVTVADVDKIVEYVGVTDSNYTNAYFYKCVEDSDTPGTYKWDAVPVQAGSGSGALGHAITSVVDVGGIDKGDTFAKGTSYDDMWDALLNPTIVPTFTAPSATLTYSADTYVEVGGTIAAKTATLAYDAGAITLDGTKQDDRGGAATNYAVATTGADTEYTDSSNSGTFSIPALTRATKGTIKLTGTVSYAQGPQPKDSKGNDYDSPLPAGTVTATKTINFIQPYYYGKSATSTVSSFTGLTKNVTAKGQKQFKFTTNNEYMVMAYDSSYGNLTSILDPNGFETISGWTKSTLTVGGFSYYVYVANSATTDTNAQFTFKY